MDAFESKFQLGKGGLSQGFIDAVANSLKSHRQARISVLRSAASDKKVIKKMAEEIASKMPFRSCHRIIGFTIILIKLGKAKQSVQ